MTVTIQVKKDVLQVETSLLKILSLRENYDKYYNYLNFNKLLPNTALLLKDYKQYFDLYNERLEIDFEEFYTQFSQNWHAQDLENYDIEYYRDYVFKAIQDCEDLDVDKCLLGLIKSECIAELEALMKKDFDFEKIRNYIDKCEKRINDITKSIDKDAQLITTVDFDVLDKSKGLHWFLPSLQESLLSITLGQFIVISADYGTGKSAFVISQLVHSLQQLRNQNDKRPILYFNSEGTSADVYARMLSNLYREQIIGGFESVVEKYSIVVETFLQTYTDSQIMVFQISTTPTLQSVINKIKKYKPALTIIDICDKLAPEEDVLSLKKLYDSLRVLSADVCPIIGTSQSGNTCYLDAEAGEMKHRKWLGAADLYGSKPGKGGAADTIITIGKESDKSSLRFISVPKKKRGEAVRVTCELIDKYSYYQELNY